MGLAPDINAAGAHDTTLLVVCGEVFCSRVGRVEYTQRIHSTNPFLSFTGICNAFFHIKIFPAQTS